VIQVVVDDLAFLPSDAVVRPVTSRLDATTPAVRRLETVGGPAFVDTGPSSLRRASIRGVRRAPRSGARSGTSKVWDVWAMRARQPVKRLETTQK